MGVDCEALNESVLRSMFDLDDFFFFFASFLFFAVVRLIHYHHYFNVDVLFRFISTEFDNCKVQKQVKQKYSAVKIKIMFTCQSGPVSQPARFVGGNLVILVNFYRIFHS